MLYIVFRGLLIGFLSTFITGMAALGLSYVLWAFVDDLVFRVMGTALTIFTAGRISGDIEGELENIMVRLGVLRPLGWYEEVIREEDR